MSRSSGEHSSVPRARLNSAYCVLLAAVGRGCQCAASTRSQTRRGRTLRARYNNTHNWATGRYAGCQWRWPHAHARPASPARVGERDEPALAPEVGLDKVRELLGELAVERVIVAGRRGAGDGRLDAHRLEHGRELLALRVRLLRRRQALEPARQRDHLARLFHQPVQVAHGARHVGLVAPPRRLLLRQQARDPAALGGELGLGRRRHLRRRRHPLPAGQRPLDGPHKVLGLVALAERRLRRRAAPAPERHRLGVPQPVPPRHRRHRLERQAQRLSPRHKHNPVRRHVRLGLGHARRLKRHLVHHQRLHLVPHKNRPPTARHGGRPQIHLN